MLNNNNVWSGGKEVAEKMNRVAYHNQRMYSRRVEEKKRQKKGEEEK